MALFVARPRIQCCLERQNALLGADPLHSFEEQLSEDVHLMHHKMPLQMWEKGVPTELPDNLTSDSLISEAGSGTTIEIEGDNATETAALQFLEDSSRHDSPWALCVGFMAPHFPFVVPEPYFSMYYPDNVDLPTMPDGHLENLPKSAKRLLASFSMTGSYPTEDTAKARVAYYGQITWMDEKIGKLLDTLQKQNMGKNTVVIYTSDHGESLGEHGLWRKNTFYEQASRIPLQIKWPGVIPKNQRISQCVLLVDLTSSILEMAGIENEPTAHWSLDGDSLLPLMTGNAENWKDEVFCEYEAHGTDRVRAMIKTGDWKLSYSHGTPPELELYNLDANPGEFNNVANESRYRSIHRELIEKLLSKWDPEKVTESVLRSQRSRQIIEEQTDLKNNPTGS